MPKIFNTLVKWCVRLGVLALGILSWDKTGQACDTATKENRYVGGRTASKLVKHKLGLPQVKRQLLSSRMLHLP